MLCAFVPTNGCMLNRSRLLHPCGSDAKTIQCWLEIVKMHNQSTGGLPSCAWVWCLSYIKHPRQALHNGLPRALLVHFRTLQCDGHAPPPRCILANASAPQELIRISVIYMLKSQKPSSTRTTFSRVSWERERTHHDVTGSETRL